VLVALFTLLLGLTQTAPAGTVIGIVKDPTSGRAAAGARVVLLPPKYTELWDRQVQSRLDNYWELFKPEFAARKESFLGYSRIAQIEALRYVTASMRRELGDATKLIKESSPTGQFEFRSVPLGTYQLIVHATALNGQDLIWSKTVEVQTDAPIFVDLGKPVS
jgi:hypothetical protein